jgi:hypothetical protein
MAVEQIDHVRSDVSAQPGPHHLPFERLTMVTKKPKGLGRGLEALLGPKVQEAPDTASYAESGLPSQLKLEQMVAGMYQPRTRTRTRMDGMGELSIQFGSIDGLNGLIEKCRA